MSKRVNAFFNTFKVPYEGIDLGANSDLLPSSLVGLIEEWIANWDPRQLKQLSMVWFREPVCEHSVTVRKDQERYYDALAVIAAHPAMVASLKIVFKKRYTQLDCYGKSAAIQSWMRYSRKAMRWDYLSSSWQPLL